MSPPATNESKAEWRSESVSNQAINKPTVTGVAARDATASKKKSWENVDKGLSLSRGRWRDV